VRWKDNIPTKEEFMAEVPEVYVITDTKYAEAEYYELQFKKIVENAAEHNCEDVLKRYVRRRALLKNIGASGNIARKKRNCWH